MDKMSQPALYTPQASALEERRVRRAIPSTTGPPHEARLLGIGAVTRITGIPETTLRAWERRYGFPQARRSMGGHRLYAQQDVLDLLWVRMRLDDGMRAGRVIQARLTTDRETAIAAALRHPLAASVPPDPARVALQQRLLEILLAYDSAGAGTILREVVARHSVERVVLDVVGPIFAAVGGAWSAVRLPIAAEHFTTNFLRHQLLAWMHASPPPFQVRPVVLACAPEELHEGSLLMLGILLSCARWPVRHLGQSLPLRELPILVDRLEPALIVFVAMREAGALALAGWPLWLAQRAETQLPIIGFGGRAFASDPALVEHVPGTLLGRTLDEGWRRIHRRLLHINVIER